VHDNVGILAPAQDGIVLDLDVARAARGFVFVDHRDSSLIVFIKGSGAVLWVAQLEEDRSQVQSNLTCLDRRNKFGFGGRGSGDGLHLRRRRDGATSKAKDDTSDRPMLFKGASSWGFMK